MKFILLLFVTGLYAQNVCLNCSSGGGGGASVPVTPGVVKSNGTVLQTAAAGTDYQAPLTLPLSVANGGTNTATPGLIAGTGITVTGTWPNQTINTTVTGGVTSFNSRTGAVVPASNDYSFAQLSGTTSVVQNSQANTYTAGSKQTFGASATTAGAKFAGVTADPSSPVAGDLWFRSDLTQLSYYNGTATKRLSVLNSFTDFLGLTTGAPSSTTVLAGDGSWGTLSTAYNVVTTGTNTNATQTCGTGCSILTSGTGSISATKINGTAAGSAATQNANTFSLSGGYLSNTYTVGTGGVTAGHLVQFDASGNVVAATTGYGGIAVSTQTVGLSVDVIRHAGIASCVFENTAVIGDIVIPGTTDHTECRDSGLTSTAAVSSATQIIGVVSSAGTGTQTVRIHPVGSYGTLISDQAHTFTAQQIISLNGALSTSPFKMTGTWVTSGGTATTTKPQVLIEPSGATSTFWSTNGTALGINAATGFTGNLIDVRTNGAANTNAFTVNWNGQVGTNNLLDSNNAVAIGAGYAGVLLQNTRFMGWGSSTANNGTYDTTMDRISAGLVGFGKTTSAGAFDGGIKLTTFQQAATSTDPTCSVTGDIGKMWVDNTSATTTHFKVCAAVASTATWVTVF